MVIINFKKIKSINHLLIKAAQKYRARFLVVAILGFTGGLFESFGIAAVIPLFFLITGQTNNDPSIVTSIVQRIFAYLHVPINPPVLLTFIISLFIAKGLIQFIARYLNAKITSSFEREAREELLNQTLKTNWLDLLNQKIGYLESILIYDVERSSNLLSQITNIILIMTSFVMYAGIAFSISSKITILTLAVGGTIFFLLKPVFYRIRKLYEEASMIQKSVTNLVSENMIGAKLIKASGLENAVIKKGVDFFKNLQKAKIKSAYYRQSALAFIEPLAFTIITILFIFSYKNPGFNIVAFAVVMYLIQRMFSFLQSVQSQLHALNESVPYLSAMLEYREAARAHKEKDPGTQSFVFREKLEFKQVKFIYSSHASVLSDITFSMPKGSMTGIVGPSGSGKTTLVDLLLRLLDVTGGDILIDSQNINDIKLADWRKHVAYVPQDTFLLNDSVENNIKFYDEGVTQDDIIQATKIANIYDAIQDLPEKFNTFVGERGLKLSGGQRQRIALARALAKKPQILILDEATSALDTESESLIKQAIDSLRGTMTVIVIAHRLSTVINADNLIVVENGEIKENGPPQKLLENHNSYLYRVRN